MRKIVAVTAVIISSQLHAQTDSSKAMGEVVVTANRFPQKQNTTGKVVTVITREELQKNSGRILSELLNQQAGIHIIGAQNNLGTNQDLYMRGASTGQTLVLIDGIPAYDPSTISTAFDINHFNIDQIERIEIVRGAMSTLYGSDAVAGVINIITRKGGNKPLGVYAHSSAGSFSTFKNVTGISGSLGKSSYNLHYSNLNSKGISSAFDSTGRQRFDRDGYNQNILSANFRTALAHNLQWKVNGQFGEYQTDLDASAFTDEKDYTSRSRNLQAGTGFEYRYRKGTVYLNYHFNRTQRDYLNDSTYVSGFNRFSSEQYVGRSQVVEAYTNLHLFSKLSLLVGGDLRYQNTDQLYSSVSSFGPYKSERGADSSRMNQYSLFASVFLKELGGFHMELGGRYNKHSEYGDNFTYTINPSFLINQQLKVFVNVASAFKAPSLYQLFVINSGQAALKPETSRTFDGGIEYSAHGLTARAVYFNRRIENGIDYSYVTYRYFNNNLQKDHGLELEARYQTGKLNLNANYTYVTGEVNTVKYRYNPATFSYEATGDTTYNNLFRRPAHTLNLTAGVQVLKDLYVSARTRIAGHRWEPVFMGAPLELKNYYTIDLYAEYGLHPAIKVFADFKNITDQRFFDVRGYNARPFHFMAGLNINL